MRKLAILIIATVATASTPTFARDNAMPWIVGGVVGAMVGSALLASPQYAPPQYAPPPVAYYPPTYYEPDPYYRHPHCQMVVVGYDNYRRPLYQRYCE